MRLRLFTLLLIPALIVFVLAASIVSERNEQHKAAISASETASLAQRTAVLDEAIGVEALAGARAIGESASVSEFVEASTRTDAALAEIRADASKNGDQELLSALVPVGEALSLRGDVERGLVSPLQLLDRYTQLRQQLLAHLTQRVSLAAGSATDPLRGLIAVIEARSEHLDERLELELAIGYQTWAPGLFGEVALSIGLQQDRLAEAASLSNGARGNLTPPKLLQEYREEVLLETVIPTFSLASYQRVSDDWITTLNSRIAADAGRIERELAFDESVARSERNETAVTVVIGLVAAMLVAGFVSYGIVHRLRVITDRAHRFAGGSLPDPGQEPIRGNDEISELAGTFDDMVDQVHQRDRRLAAAARTDDLTGIGNRQHIMDVWSTAVASDSGAVACLIDLDKFKPINDDFGHHVGDLVLQSMASRLSTFVESTNGQVGRIGGDEFLVVLSDFGGGHDDLVSTMQRLAAVIAEPITFKGSTFVLEVSIGVVRTRSGVGYLELLRDADEAMYSAKGSEVGEAVVSTPDLRAELVSTRNDRIAVVEALRLGQIVPWFQPIRTASNELAGFEALARWTSDDGTVRASKTFIDILETEHLLPQLDSITFEAVCRQVVAWNEMGLTVDRVSVNFSAASIQRPDFGETIFDILDETGCPPNQLAVEVTESVLMSDIETNAHLLQVLRKRGIRIDVDDFGTGYSSLRYLRDLPVDSVKIDRVFIASISEFPASQAIVRSVIALAKDLNICVVAEGVETPEELDWLVANRADKLQGYLLGFVVPAEQATMLLKQEMTREMQAA